MKIFLILLLIVSCSIAQYGPVTLMPNGSFETFTGTADDGTTDDFTSWTEDLNGGQLDASTSYTVDGSYSVHIIGSGVGSSRVRRNYNNVGVGYYRVGITAKNNTIRGGIISFQISNGTTDSTYYSTGSVWVDGGDGSGGGTKRWLANVRTSSTKPQLSMYIGAIQGSPVTSYYADYNTYQSILDTIWTYSTGSDVDYDTTLTLGEVFTRGTHSGGVVITEAGTYSETIASIDSSFSKWYSASTDCVKVDAVNFNSVTVECYNIYVTTPTNYSNVTFLYNPAVPASFSPSDGATNVSITPTLSWSDDAQADSFYVKLSANSDLSSAILDTAIADSFIAVSGLSNLTQYYWLVAGKNQFTTTYADTISFTTATAVSAATIKRDYGGYTKYKGFK